MNEAVYAPLAPTLIRRPFRAACDVAVRPSSAAGMADDLRLFAFTWAAGFVFMIAFLS
jgi:hypothetical protein